MSPKRKVHNFKTNVQKTKKKHKKTIDHTVDIPVFIAYSLFSLLRYIKYQRNVDASLIVLHNIYLYMYTL